MKALRTESAGIVIDIQERLAPAVSDSEKTIRTVVKFIKGLRILQAPVVVVRHCPNGLGDIVPEIRHALGEYTPFDKVTFSAHEEPCIASHLRTLGKKNLFVVGMEAHVCVLQSIIDFAHAGYTTFALGDCVASRNPYDKEMALRRAEKEGVYPTTCEAALFELLGRADAGAFKDILSIVK